VVVSFGAGLFVQLGFTVAQAKALTEDVPAATAFIGLAQTGGINVSLAMANAVFLNQAIRKLHAAFPTASQSEIMNAVSGTASGFLNALDPGAKRVAIEQIVDTLREVFVYVIVAGGLVLLLCSVLKHTKLESGNRPKQRGAVEKDAAISADGIA
jgi:hypothetical protein